MASKRQSEEHSAEWFFPGHDPYTGKELPRTRAMEQSSPGRDPDTDKKPSRVRPERSWGMGKIIWLVVEGMMGIFALVFLTLFASIGDLVTVVVGTLFGTAMIGSLVIGTLREDERIPLWRE